MQNLIFNFFNLKKNFFKLKNVNICFFEQK